MNYELEIGAESAQSEHKVWLPPETSDGPTARIRHSSGLVWFGYFPGRRVPEVTEQFVATPDADHFLFWSNEVAMLVAANEPGTFIPLPIWGIYSALAVPSLGIILVENGTEISVCDATGVLWKTDRISWDGFEQLAVEGDVLRGMSWSAPGQDWREFALNLRTRAVAGGAYNRSAFG